VALALALVVVLPVAAAVVTGVQESRRNFFKKTSPDLLIS
jgi:hypothetical protein